MRPRTLTEAELARARAVIQNQAGTVPEDGDLSPAGSIRRAEGVRNAVGGRAVQPHGQILGWPSLMERRDDGRR